MRPEQIRNEIDRLELSEKLILVEDIWDSIAVGNSELVLPEWQKAELNRRYGDFRDGRLALHDWTEVHGRLREKYK
jgi:putative addiction module component (TIGR02574 family)